MGITLFQADLIIQEHLRKPLPETVHLLGKQTVSFDYSTACHLLKRHGLTPPEIRAELDHTTLGSQGNAGNYITDTTFFQMLGVKEVLAIDHSNYEGAEIIVDLNKPLPPGVQGIADFIYGGSVLDNIFDPAMYLRNINQLLRAGGRLVDHNTCSFRDHPYMVISPAWYLDYCVLNRFAHCQIYVTESGAVARPLPVHVYALEIHPDDVITPDLGTSQGGMAAYVTVIAEKGTDTTWNRTPAQDQYRSPEEWHAYREQLTRMQNNPATNLKLSTPTPTHLAAYAVRHVRGLRYLGLFDHTLPLATEPLDANLLWSDNNNRGIRVVEATYGWNQKLTALPRTGLVPVYRGNVTGIIAFLINGRNGCDWEVDVNFIGDPAPGLPKDLSVFYYRMDDPDLRIQHAYLPAEAHGKRLHIPFT